MPPSLKEIQAPIATEMEAFELKFRQYMATQVVLLDKIMTYIVKRKGKQLRPMFVFLMANTCGGSSDKTHRGAALIELLHTATLVHDDVVDDAGQRRGFFSINALWKNKIAVLVGDYLLSRGLLLSVDHQDFDLLKLVSNAVREMSEGELLQMEKARLLNITEGDYYQIIRQKTASLIASCCAVGASSSTSDDAVIDRARLFGEKVGMAFQIKDDLFDYGNTDIGKPRGIDIKEKKMTLPLIYTLQQSGWMEKRRIVNIVKNESHKASRVNEVIELVKSSGGIDYAQRKMDEYLNDAFLLLDGFTDNIYRNSLRQLVQYTVEREK